METDLLSEKDLKRGAQLLLEGELIAFPTETVYGLGAPIFAEKTIQKIFSTKGRPQDNPLIAHITELADCHRIAREIPESFFILAEAFFPGPLTLVLKKRREVPPLVSAGLDTIAIRMPKHPIARALIQMVGEPLVAPSANLSGRPSSTCASHVLEDFQGLIRAVIDGGVCEHGIESTVLDLVSFKEPTLLRPGSITKEALEEVLGCKVVSFTKGAHSSPGMKYRHYAPKAFVKVFFDLESFTSYCKAKTEALILSSKKLAIPHFPLNAATLYSSLRYADQKGYQEIVILCDRDAEVALLNRLEKIVESKFT